MKMHVHRRERHLRISAHRALAGDGFSRPAVYWRNRVSERDIDRIAGIDVERGRLKAVRRLEAEDCPTYLVKARVVRERNVQCTVAAEKIGWRRHFGAGVGAGAMDVGLR